MTVLMTVFMTWVDVEVTLASNGDEIALMCGCADLLMTALICQLMHRLTLCSVDPNLLAKIDELDQISIEPFHHGANHWSWSKL
jgi:hypothetical protein